MRYTGSGSMVTKVMLAAALAAGSAPACALAETEHENTGHEKAQIEAQAASICGEPEELAQAELAEQAVLAAQDKVDLARKTYEDLKPTAEEAEKKIAQGSLGFFEEYYDGSRIADDYAPSLLTYRLSTYAPVAAPYVHIGEADDATSLENMKLALERMRKINDIRVTSGLSELKITDSAMAAAQVNADYSAVTNKHLTDTTPEHYEAFDYAYFSGSVTPYKGHDNLAWGYTDPYKGWYDEEKTALVTAVKDLYGVELTCDIEIYDYYYADDDRARAIKAYAASELSEKALGHYLHLINPDHTIYGCAYSNRGSYYSNTDVVTPQTNEALDYTEYTYTEYYDRFMSYYDELVDAVANLKDAETTLSQAEDELASAQEAAAVEKLRISGETRYETSQAISSAGFDAAETVVIASGENLTDALAASSAAGVYGAPVLLTDPDALSPYIVDEIERLGANDIIVVGSEAAVSGDVMDEIANRYEARGFRVSRIAGDTRQDAARQIAERFAAGFEGDPAIERGGTCIVASGDSYADALAASPYAYARLAPIFLTEADGSLSDATAQAIESIGFKHVVMVGGTARVSQEAEATLRGFGSLESVERIAGEDRYETAVKMAQLCISAGMGYDGVAVASGENLPDAIAGGALCGSRGSVMLLAGKTDESAAETQDVLEENKDEISSANVLGGSAAVSDNFAVKMAKALGILQERE